MKLSFLSLAALIVALSAGGAASAQFPGLGGGGGTGRNASGTGDRGLGIGTYDTKTVTHDRVVTGMVRDKDGAPLKGAIVYLKNDTSKAIKSMTVDETGKFRFPQLSRTVDYQLWAESKNKKTDAKTISQFDNRDTISRELSMQ